MYKYYSTQRPVSPGTFPNKYDNRPVEVENFDERQWVEGESFRAWGWLIYKNPLSEKEIDDFELREGTYDGSR